LTPWEWWHFLPLLEDLPAAQFGVDPNAGRALFMLEVARQLIQKYI
jgi:hypothetical protein